MLAKEVMSRNVAVVESSDSWADMVALVRECLPECLVVQNETVIEGVVVQPGISCLLAGKVKSLDQVISKKVIFIREDSFLNREIIGMATKGYMGALVTNGSGWPVGYLSAELLLEAAYRKIMKQNRIIEAIPIGVLAIDRHGNLSMANKAAERILDFKASTCIGQHISKTNHSSALIKALRTGKSISAQKVIEGDNTLVIGCNPIRLQNITIGAVEVLQDISFVEHLSNELETVQILNEELETIIRSSFDEIFVTDGEGITIKVSDSVRKNSGKPANFFIGRSVDELEEEGLFVPSAAKKAIASKEIVTVSSITDLGKEIVTTATPVMNEQGEIEKVVCNIRDLTELSQLKKRLEETENMALTYRMKLAALDAKKAKLEGIIGISPQVAHIKEMICKVADLESHIFITGESGVGKGVIARAIHVSGRRAKKPFITVNCGAIPESLIESEFFGYEQGAFTGASKTGKQGLVELASGGTLFLDEIAEMPYNLQVKLLAFIQDKRYLRVGGNREKTADVRIVAATNKDLKELVSNGQLREDLYYRLNVFPIHVPPLRFRREDIVPLLQHKLRKLNELYQTHKVLKPETLDVLVNYDWPGNVRELENILERIVITSETYEIGLDSLPDYIYAVKNSEGPELLSVSRLCTIEEATAEAEKQLLEKARGRYKTTTKMAEALGVNQSTIVRKLKRYNIS